MSLPIISVEVMFASPTWTDVTAWAKRSVSTRRGSSRVISPVIRYEAGTATVTLNNTDRRFDPTNLSGPYVSGGKTQVQPNRPIRIRATYNSITYNLFRGFVDLWDVHWYANVYSETVVTATDAFKVLAQKRRAATTVMVDGEPVVQTFGEGEDSGDRVDRILDSAGWSSDRSVSLGNSTLQATALEGDPLSELQEVAESEIGELYVDGQGRVVFRNRWAIHTEARSTTVQATFGNPSTSIAPYELKLNTDDATFYNEAIAQRDGGEQQVTDDAASIAEYGVTRTHEGSGLLLETDGEALNWGQWIVFLSRDPEQRFDELHIHCHANPSVLFPAVLAREIGDRIEIVYRPPGGGTITKEAFIRGIAHHAGEARWITTFQLQSARNFGSFFTLNHASLGLLGSGTPMVF